MKALRNMATFAAQHNIKGRSLVRNAILKPLDIILEQIEKEPKDDPDVRDLVQNAVVDMITEHLKRVAAEGFKPGRKKEEQVKQYVTFFFDDLLKESHRNDVNRLLQRSKLLRSAYLIYFRTAFAAYLAAKNVEKTNPDNIAAK